MLYFASHIFSFFYGTFSALSLLLDAHNPWSAHQALFL